MALSDAVLKNFFDKTKKPLTHNLQKETSETNPPTRYRVFDDPLNTDDTSFSTEINLGQTKDKHKTNIVPKGGQSQDKPRTNLRQEKTISQKTGDKLRAEPRTRLGTNLGQSQDKLTSIHHFSSLVGLQRKIAIFIYDSCQFCRSDVSNPLAIEHIAKSCQTTKLSAQKTLQRLEKKQIIFRDSFKNGRGGWTRYRLLDAVFQEISQENLQSKLRTNLGQTQDKVESELRTESRTTLSSSSSSLNIKNTTTKIPEEFDGIDFEALSPYGFTDQHLIQIIERSGLSKEMIQDSLDAFSFDLRKNNKAAKLKTTPLNCIMGTLTKGRLYNPPENYITPQQESMMQYLAAKKAEKERQEKIEKESCDLAFNDWRSRVGDSESEKIINEIAKENPYTKNTEHTAKMALRHYYYEKIWPDEKKYFFEKALGAVKNNH